MRGFARVSVAVPEVRVADFDANLEHTLALLEQAHDQGDALVVFPELGLCGYTVRDLLLDHHLLESCEDALRDLLDASPDTAPLAVVGMPVRVGGGIYNCGVAIHRGRVLGVVPKAYLPTYREFEEARWFRPGTDVPPGSMISIADQTVPFGLDLLLEAEDDPDLVIGLEICEDYWVHVPPSVYQVSAGATVIANLSASNFTVGKAELRRLLARSASDRGKCAYLYVAAGPGESSTDLAFDADAFICENGRVLAESTRFARTDQLVTADVDIEQLVRERASTNTFGDCSRENRKPFRRIPFRAGVAEGPLRREVAAHPFLPSDPQTLATRCWEIFEIQSNALATRIKAIGEPKLILGLSGGLDSSMAALVCAAALDLLDRPRSDLLCVTMPGLGTTAGTRTNAEVLAAQLGARFEEVGVSEASQLLLRSVGHGSAEGTTTVEELLERVRKDPSLGDVTLENVQARLRTLVLMTLANKERGFVVGTGDLSEKALGWSTYAGDHIAMYDVNAGVPKTLIRFVIRWVANERAKTWSEDGDALREVLFEILDTPISPELLPADESGRIAQLTESAIGPYELHDFFLYYVVRQGARPGRVLDLARVAFGEVPYSLDELKKWLTVFYRRFFQNQFKRSCTADGPKVGMVALSPRGDWRMPSDANVASWIEAVASYEA
ncbi:MAG: NAD(+) synthase [Sandaracinaceae bacterium]|nr:NAD(+) synthase [Sandaracinaceae bacterium]